MTDKDLFLNKNLSCGGSYELCIQVCPSIQTKPIEEYTNFIWTSQNVAGPFNNEFNKVAVNINNFVHRGILHLQSYTIPFNTFNIKEEPIETVFNWFSISLHTAAIESVFGSEYQIWTDNPNPPEILQTYLIEKAKELYKIYPFQLALIDFEISGQYYLEDLKGEISNWHFTKFFVGRENYQIISDRNKSIITIID